MAQGGIAAPVGAEDSPHLHAVDTLRAGAGVCNEHAVRIMCDEAMSAVHWLENHGARFDREGERHAVHREAAHSRARVLHIDDDRTGFSLTRMLAQSARSRLNIEFQCGYTAAALTRDSAGVTGVIALDRSSRAVWLVGRETVLATGGLGQLYSHTTNPRTACGDGLAMALIAGADCAALEYVQFHPTALDVAADPMPLMTEALRGAGAKLIDEHGASVMNGVHVAADLAPRDVIAREVWRRMRDGARVYLDASGVFSGNPEAFPAVRSICARYRIDPKLDPIPVAPAAHYHMGGIAVDLEGRSSLEHLWACGEVACTGVHGANRLASNSLLEAVVFGRRLGRALTDAREDTRRLESPVPDPANESMTLAVEEMAWTALRRLMWAYAGIARDAVGLQTALKEMRQLEFSIPAGQILLRNRVRLAKSILGAALERRMSRGAHFRSDCRPGVLLPDLHQGARMRVEG